MTPHMKLDEKAVEAALVTILGYRPRLLNETPIDDLCAGLGRMRASEVQKSLEAAIAAYLSASHAPQGGVRVKELSWEPYPVTALQSDDVAVATVRVWRQQYQVSRDPRGDGYVASLHPIGGTDSTRWWEERGLVSFEAGKAVAQADYEARILAALTGSDPQ